MGMNRLNEWVLLLSEPEHPAVALYADNFTLVKSKLTTDHWVCLRLAVSRWWAASHRISGSLLRVDQERPEWQPATLDVIEDSGSHYCQDYKACSWSDKGPPSLTTHQHNHWSASFILALITLVPVSLFHNWPFLCGSWIRCPHGTSIIVTFSATMWLSCDSPVVRGWGNRSTRWTPQPNHKSLVTLVQPPPAWYFLLGLVADIEFKILAFPKSVLNYF